MDESLYYLNIWVYHFDANSTLLSNNDLLPVILSKTAICEMSVPALGSLMKMAILNAPYNSTVCRGIVIQYVHVIADCKLLYSVHDIVVTRPIC